MPILSSSQCCPPLDAAYRGIMLRHYRSENARHLRSFRSSAPRPGGLPSLSRRSVTSRLNGQPGSRAYHGWSSAQGGLNFSRSGRSSSIATWSWSKHLEGNTTTSEPYELVALPSAVQYFHEEHQIFLPHLFDCSRLKEYIPCISPGGSSSKVGPAPCEGNVRCRDRRWSILVTVVDAGQRESGRDDGESIPAGSRQSWRCAARRGFGRRSTACRT